MSGSCLLLLLSNFSEISLCFFLPPFLQRSVHPTLTGLSSFHPLYVFMVGISPLQHIKSFGAPKPALLCEFNEGCVVVGAVSYLSLIFQLSAVGLVYNFPNVVVDEGAPKGTLEQGFPSLRAVAHLVQGCSCFPLGLHSGWDICSGNHCQGKGSVS